MRSLVYKNSKQWDLALAQTEFAYNDTPNRSTGMSPFHIVFGMHQRGVYELKYLGKKEVRSTKAGEFAEKMKKLQEDVKKKFVVPQSTWKFSKCGLTCPIWSTDFVS